MCLASGSGILIRVSPQGARWRKMAQGSAAAHTPQMARPWQSQDTWDCLACNIVQFSECIRAQGGQPTGNLRINLPLPTFRGGIQRGANEGQNASANTLLNVRMCIFICVCVCIVCGYANRHAHIQAYVTLRYITMSLRLKLTFI